MNKQKLAQKEVEKQKVKNQESEKQELKNQESEKQELKNQGTDLEEQGCCCSKTKQRSSEEVKSLINRLNRIEGQIRGIKGMVEKDCYCVDIMTQVSAVNAALNSFNKILLADHIHTCVAEDIRQGNDEVIDELMGILQKLMR